MRVCSENLKATIGGIEYIFWGGFGCILQSNEWGVKRGDVRIIGDIVFYAYQTEISIPFFKKEISWVPNLEIDAKWIRDFKRAVFQTEE